MAYTYMYPKSGERANKSLQVSLEYSITLLFLLQTGLPLPQDDQHPQGSSAGKKLT